MCHADHSMNVVFETDPQARDQHIESIVGIAPYYGSTVRGSRPYISTVETEQLIAGVKRKETNAAQLLIASRLVWMYENFAQREELQAFPDLTLEEVIQNGCVATIEAARLVDFDSQTPPTTQYMLEVPALMRKLLGQTKSDREIAVEPHKIVDLVDGKQGDTQADTEEDAIRAANSLEGSFMALLSHVDERNRNIVATRLGLAEASEPQSAVETAAMFGITRGRVYQIEEKVLSSLKNPDFMLEVAKRGVLQSTQVVKVQRYIKRAEEWRELMIAIDPAGSSREFAEVEANYTRYVEAANQAISQTVGN